MKYQALSGQQHHVIGETYKGVSLIGCDCDPENVVGGKQVYCSPRHKGYVNNEVFEAFRSVLQDARTSNAFDKIFASWDGNGYCLALFGVLHSGDLVLLAEYALHGTIPSYQDRLRKAQSRYRAYWPARIVNLAMIAFGIYLIHISPDYLVGGQGLVHVNPDLVTDKLWGFGCMFLLIGIWLGSVSLWRFIRLHRRAIEPRPYAPFLAPVATTGCEQQR